MNSSTRQSRAASVSRLSRAGRCLALSLALSVGWVGMASSVQAGMIGTQAVAEAGAAQQRLLDAFNRADVQQALVARGVDPAQAQLRIAALSDAQAEALLAEIDQAPAGADILGTIVFIFVLLLVTDILGFTKVYPFTRSIR
ncbi:conserved hypothetical protein [Leptothrix cholodnii SP-6]|uniref:PA2779 family protein n=1 Tax=Leptothrix cholodnii (strain ATCC 51168 / LMG 8142 / SP-6) TaxID=395495 RepID=B1Y5G8_LEPCP|nr:PA2779 family protein [Leptothrix cholodnii]ACB33556.1 conserved hypothetical protein [Leptothrix cholodnii SP-6]